jgi:hypothetical protein
MKQIGKTEIHEKLNGRSIDIWLDCYDDIFSDFDSRPYTERRLSDDFVAEVNKLAGESDLPAEELKLLLPEGERDAETESIIGKRLHSYFKDHNNKEIVDKRKATIRACVMLVAGFALMIGAAYTVKNRSESFLHNFLFVILEPGGWFLVWNGFDELIFSSRKRQQAVGFYTKVARSKIMFLSIRDEVPVRM